MRRFAGDCEVVEPVLLLMFAASYLVILRNMFQHACSQIVAKQVQNRSIGPLFDVEVGEETILR